MWKPKILSSASEACFGVYVICILAKQKDFFSGVKRVCVKECSIMYDFLAVKPIEFSGVSSE